jgi:hypothetical protein
VLLEDITPGGNAVGAGCQAEQPVSATSKLASKETATWERREFKALSSVVWQSSFVVMLVRPPS